MSAKQYRTNTCVSAFDFFSRFPDQDTAQRHIEEIRWHGKPVCPYCGSEHVIFERKTSGRYYTCVNCRSRFTVRVGTVFERSHIPLHKWLYAIYLVMASRKGISSVQLSKELGITQKSAWFMLQRIRHALGGDDDDNSGIGAGGGLLKDIVEIDEAYFGGKDENRHEYKRHNLGGADKTIVVGMRERGTGRTRGYVVGNTRSNTMTGLIFGTVATGSVICTDESLSYTGIEDDYIRRTVNHSAKQYVDGMAYTNGIESYWATLKRGFYGIFHWFSVKHAQRYVDEFAFRMYEGSCKRHMYSRIESALMGTFGKRLTYRSLTA